MTIVAVISTPEKNGNTEAVVNKIAESAKANGQDVKTFYLNPMTNRKGCQACFGCKAKGRCVQNDDLTPVLDAIREADGIILSTPVYFGEACGQYSCSRTGSSVSSTVRSTSTCPLGRRSRS